MLRLSCRVVGHPCLLLLLILFAANSAFAQLETATVSGQVVDPSGLRIAGAQVRLIDIDRDTTVGTATTLSGLYTFPSVRPGRYRMEVIAVGFKVVNVTGMTVNVQDHLEQNFKLAVGSVSESVTVEGGAPLVNTESAAVSTVVDRNFAENLPMNGRSFQTLIELTPGVVLTPSNSLDPGQFSINGQRASSNYWMVDGTSANFGVSAFVAGGVGGSLPSLSAQGGTNSLVSVDAMQEFRIQTSTFAPEFGRTPGGQISIVTRSGTNQLHGTVFDYIRNDVLDANDWFNGYINAPPLPKAEERQNDFGGTLSGPILKDRTFFFFSYEGLRLRLPQTSLTTVPDLLARQNASQAIQPYLDAFPLPNGMDNAATGIAQFNSSFSNPSTLDAYSLRVDHRLTDKLNLFGRYNNSPSEIASRGLNGTGSLSNVERFQIRIQTATVGATWTVSPTLTNDLRFNYSRSNASSDQYLDNFGGAVPLASVPLPSPYTTADSYFHLFLFSLTQGAYVDGLAQRNVQRQTNVVDSVAMQKGSHTLKYGIDFRRLAPIYEPPAYAQDALFSDVPSTESGNLLESFIVAQRRATLLFRNLSLYLQDTWRVAPRLTLTYGLRWDVDFAPSSINGPNLLAVNGFNWNNFSNLAVAPSGTPVFQTKYGNIAPRVGVAYQVRENPDWQIVVRGGLGMFYDLADTELSSVLLNVGYPFFADSFNLGGTFPLPTGTAAQPAFTPPGGGSGTLAAFDPNLELPYTLQWNVALEQALGRSQSISASYVGSVGRRLIQSALIFQPNPNYASGYFVGNSATSNYGALQIQFQRRLSHGLQALASYSWSHSIDTASAGSTGITYANALEPSLRPNANGGPSDFDIRNAFSAGLTYEVAFPKTYRLATTILRGWSLQNVILARSAPPVNIFDSFGGAFPILQNTATQVRPDVIPGVPFYLFGPQYPGGRSLNNTLGAGSGGCPSGSQSVGPFCPPPTDANGNLLRQGDLGRNALRGFGAAQWDFAVHREFPIREQLKLQFRAEVFNILNHPNFGAPVGDISLPNFGLSTQMLGRSLDVGNQGGGSFSPLYQIGGPRSVQLGLKLQF